MISLIIFFPLATALVVMMLPSPRAVRWAALLGSLATLGLTIVVAYDFESGGAALQMREVAAWIPSIGAAYYVAATGLSLGLALLTALLMAVVMGSVLHNHDRARAHAALLLFLETGLLGLFFAQDLLLFYLFYEVALVPMYFIIGVWGAERRRYAALKFFIYTRLGSLAMLLGILSLYLAMRPHTFSLPAIIQTQPLSQFPTLAAFTFFALLFGFGVKLPSVPFHNWLPDAHVEAPTEGSVVLAGLQLKMGGYGLVAIMLPTLSATVGHFAWIPITLGLLSLLYGALLSLVQNDMKRLVAFTSINHLAYVMIAVGVAALAVDPKVKQLAISGATFQMISHGLLTGAMFLLVGLIQHRAGTRELGQIGGVASTAPALAGIFALLAFGSLGLPGLSGFVGEFQVIGATLSQSIWIAAAMVLGLIVGTAVYLRLVSELLLGSVTETAQRLRQLGLRELAPAAVLAIGSVAIGVWPGPLVAAIAAGSQWLVR